MKDLVEYCPHCGKITRHKVINCTSNALERTFFAVFTLGFSEMCGNDYNCECVNCGNIRIINK